MNNLDRTPPRKVIILGAGLTGLSAADLLSEKGIEVIVIEKEEHPGGLAVTFRKNGFHFDCGPHRFHTKNPELLEYVSELLPGELIELERQSRIRLLDRYFHYPLSLGNILKQMPMSKGIGIVTSYIGEKFRNIIAPRDESNFESWVVKRFGKKLFDLYFSPYTEKLWGCPSTELSVDWASQRITVPSLSKLIKATIFTSKEDIRSLVSTFHYPKGGIGRICEVLAERLVSRKGNILYGTEPLCIKRDSGSGFTIETSQGKITADKIINTIPVNKYVHLLGNILSEDVHRASENLHFRSIIFITVRLRNRIQVWDHWIYTPEEHYLFNRLSIPENFDPDCSVNGSQVVFEFTCSEGDNIWCGRSDLLESAVSGGAKLGLFSPDDVLGSIITRQAHAYPVYDLSYTTNTSVVLDALHELEGSVTCGRQGLFRYNNMDHSIEMGRFAALEILGERTVREQFDWTSGTWADG